MHVKLPPLMVMFVRKLDDNPAAHDMRIKPFQLFRFFADMAFECFGMGHIPRGDLQSDFHDDFLLVD